MDDLQRVATAKNRQIRALKDQVAFLKKQVFDMDKILNKKRGDRDILHEALVMACAAIRKEDLDPGTWYNREAYIINLVKENKQFPKMGGDVI